MTSDFFVACSVVGSILVVIGLYTLLWGKNKEIPSSPEIQDTDLEAHKEDGVTK